MKMKTTSGVLVVFVVCLAIVFVSFGSNSIVGRWELSKNSGGRFKYLEFFSDGTYTSSHSNYEGSYSIDNDRLRLQGILVDSLTYTFEISGNNLTLYNQKGEIYCRFDKVSN